MPPPQRLPFEIPTVPPDKWTPEIVVRYVKTGMLIELGTIPLYLYSMYSIQPDNGNIGTRARAALRGVVQQEMLHLSLTGNLLCALGSSLDLYNYDVIPQYPSDILVGKIAMNLDRANKENLECFLQIEAPDTPRPQPLNSERGLLPKVLYPKDEDILPGYKSIGDFYADLAKGLEKLPGPAFQHNPDKQFSGLDFFDDQVIVITDKASALKALKTIVEQGEGNVSAFDAGFCYLLQTIQRVWETSQDPAQIVLRLLLLRNIHAIMTHILTPIASILDDGTPEPPLQPEALHTALLREVDGARRAITTLHDVKKLLGDMHDYIEKKIPSK
ncbi:hypothetical protein BS47DRAFT_1338894 [Hydnum rufescens UP504]|uniref:Iminophenyl-pyruvate dimer synthase domain-containing protein n=1 Tax=Hydnum rufescens UP504 TaxID=1448309 RepID=A0A9P6E0F2_9AGAM|nr:hypothetical protein BS47DRAFT_1338894 [Hydnum rufescens UP504]